LRRLYSSPIRRYSIAILALVAMIIGAGPARSSGQVVQIRGAGATFPYPLYSAWFAEYAKVRPDLQMNYLSIGSGVGIQQLMEAIVFFGATDAPMTEEEMQESRGALLHLPAAVGAVAPVYNLPGVKGDMRFTGAVLANMFLGRISNWNDPAIARLNPDIALPAIEITTVHRSDASGTSYIWGDFLSKTSRDWRRLFGPNRHPNLPLGTRVQGSEGVSTMVKQTPGAIGYVEIAYAARNGLEMGLVQNANGEFVKPSAASMTAAAEAAIGKMPRDFRVSITNAPGRGVYPISSFTWILLYRNPRDKRKSQSMVDFMKWALTEGQKSAPALGYGPLPPAIVTLEMAALATIKVS
jgi:phosphate transport system substrate-binding protein